MVSGFSSKPAYPDGLQHLFVHLVADPVHKNDVQNPGVFQQSSQITPVAPASSDRDEQVEFIGFERHISKASTGLLVVRT